MFHVKHFGVKHVSQDFVSRETISTLQTLNLDVYESVWRMKYLASCFTSPLMSRKGCQR